MFKPSVVSNTEAPVPLHHSKHTPYTQINDIMTGDSAS